MRIRLNLIPERVLREREARSRRRVLFGIPLIGIALVVVLYLLLAAREGQANLIARNAEQFLAPLRSTAREVLEMQQETATLEQQREELTAVLRLRRQWTDLLLEVSRVIPQDAWLTSMAIDGSTMTVTGFSLTLRSVASFTQSLAFVSGVTQVNLQSIQQVAAAGESITRYQIAARLREGP